MEYSDKTSLYFSVTYFCPSNDMQYPQREMFSFSERTSPVIKIDTVLYGGAFFTACTLSGTGASGAKRGEALDDR